MTIRPRPFLLPFVLSIACACQNTQAPAAAAAAPAKSAAPSASERLLATAAQDNRVMQHLRHLSKEIGPRLTGSEHYDRAAQWCLEQFKSWGLEAHLETWGEFPVRCDRGVQRGRELGAHARDLAILTRAWSVGTNGPVRARARLEPVDEAEFEAHKAEFAGVWLLRRSSRTLSAVRKALEAAPPAGYVTASGRELMHMSGASGRSLEEIQKQQPEIVLRGDQFEELSARISAGEPVQLEFEIENKLVAGPVACTNVVADLVGSQFPDEYVIVGGHLDSWDGAEGAQDNGTGVASTLEAARLIASLKEKPRRTLRFVLFGGEEQGLFGSAGYVKAHAAELSKVSAVLIHDDGASPLQGLDVTYAMLEDFQNVIAPVAALDRVRPVSVNERLGLVNSGDSDHAPFLGAKDPVPAFFWNQSENGYDHVHHTQFDVFENIAAADEEHNARVVAVVALGLAELDHLLDRTDMKPLPTRRLGVNFDGATITHVTPESRAAAAGWKDGDVLIAVDGLEVSNREEIVRAINQGGPRKTIRVRRGEERLEAAFDWSDDPDEPERSARAGRRDAWHKAQQARRAAAHAHS